MVKNTLANKIIINDSMGNNQIYMLNQRNVHNLKNKVITNFYLPIHKLRINFSLILL